MAAQSLAFENKLNIIFGVNLPGILISLNVEFQQGNGRVAHDKMQTQERTRDRVRLHGNLRTLSSLSSEGHQELTSPTRERELTGVFMMIKYFSSVDLLKQVRGHAVTCFAHKYALSQHLKGISTFQKLPDDPNGAEIPSFQNAHWPKPFDVSS